MLPLRVLDHEMLNTGPLSVFLEMPDTSAFLDI